MKPDDYAIEAQIRVAFGSTIGRARAALDAGGPTSLTLPDRALVNYERGDRVDAEERAKRKIAAILDPLPSAERLAVLNRLIAKLDAEDKALAERVKTLRSDLGSAL